MDLSLHYSQQLINTVNALLANGKGLLAMDESNPTCNKRFAALGIPQTAAFRRAYREMIVTTPNLSDSISGAILYDETIHQQKKDGTPFIKAIVDAGIIPGIKVDEGAIDMANHPKEKITEGLDGLRNRLKAYAQLGLRFAKWRAVITIDDTIPTASCIESNANLLARYAALCQEAGLVPIVEPEVLMDGDHSLQQCYDVTEKVLRIVFIELNKQKVLLEGMLLKPNMVVPGLACADQSTIEEVATATINCFLRSVPAAVPGIAFLSGGQSAQLASARLNAMHVQFKSKLPWAVTFSFSRAIQQPALETWGGKDENISLAQQALYYRASCNKAARRGEYNAALDK
ncbi:MAG TPA: class I fructose-bisphosphate aldolase [Ferruginibacter sp.]|nr:class I fructose-bisphosphate aldolase [Ferruginibacter sp.]